MRSPEYEEERLVDLDSAPLSALLREAHAVGETGDEVYATWLRIYLIAHHVTEVHLEPDEWEAFLKEGAEHAADIQHERSVDRETGTSS